MNCVDTTIMTNRSRKSGGDWSFRNLLCQYYWRKSLLYQQRIFDLVDRLVVPEIVERGPGRELPVPLLHGHAVDVHLDVVADAGPGDV